jgi:hypothetical protein
MNKNYHHKNVKENRVRRLNAKSLRNMLLYKFIHEYGYGKGLVAASAIVDDIVKLIQTFYVDTSHLKIGEMLWVAAVKGQSQFYGKNINNTKKKVIKLSVFNEDDIQKLGDKRVSFKEIRIARVARWINEANQQGAGLTLEDLSALIAINQSKLSEDLVKYQKKTKKLLPLRGYIEDIGGGTTHKKQIIDLHLQNYLSPDIARMTSHSKDAVDRYINDFQIISTLAKKFDRNIIPILARKSKSLVEEYLKICQTHKKGGDN